MDLITIKDMLAQNVEKYGDNVAYQMKGPDGKYRKYTYRQVGEMAKKIQSALAKMGVAKGDRVALISENRPEWAISYLAIASMGATNVPLDSMQKKEDIEPLIKDSEPKVIVLSQKYVDYPKGTCVDGKTIFMEDMEDLPAAGAVPENKVELDDLASIVYTSGTTGIPKGVMLSHRNLMWNVIGGTTLIYIDPKDSWLTVLPAHHAFETTAGILIPFYRGSLKTIPEALKSHVILQTLAETHATILGSVPMFFKLLYDGIWRQVEEQGKKKIFMVLFALSKFFKYVLRINAGRLLFAPLHKKFGNKIRFCITGGVAFDPELCKNFDLMGFKILQGYGLTETAPILGLETLQCRKPGSVGKAMIGMEVRIAGDGPVGEVLAKGPCVMQGYYKRPELTAEVIKNGWFHSGDLGYIDKDGYIFLTGRLKDVIVTGSGVNVYPHEVEAVLDRMPSIKESCVLGSKVKEGARKGTEEVVAVVVPDMEHFEKLGNKDENFIKETIAKEVNDCNKNLPAFKRVSRHLIRKEELPRTRLLKIKRFKIRKEMNIDA